MDEYDDFGYQVPLDYADQSFAVPVEEAATSYAPVDLGDWSVEKYQQQFMKQRADQDAALAAAKATGLSDQYTQLYGGSDIIPGLTNNILSNLGIENPYLPVYTLRGSANKGGDNANERMSFAAMPGVQYRLVNKRTGDVTTASTPAEIKALVEQAGALAQTDKKSADYAIESNQYGNWSPMFEDRPDFNALKDLANVVGTALPIAVGFIPGLQGVGAVLASAGAGGAGAALKGQDILKGALMGGLSAAGGQYLGDAITGATNIGANAARAIGTGVGSTVGGVVTGQDLGNALLGGIASGGLSYLGGEIMKPGSRGTGGGDAGGDIGGGSTGGGTGGGGGGLDPNTIVVNAARLANLAAPSVNFGSTPKAPPTERTAEGAPDEIVVTAGRAPDLTSSTFSVPGLAPLPKEVLDLAVKAAEEPPPPVEEPAPAEDEIVATGERLADTGSSVFTVPGASVPAAAPAGELPPAVDEIVATGERLADTGSSVFTVPGASVPAAAPAGELPPAVDEIVATGERLADTGSSVFTVPGASVPAATAADLAVKPAEEPTTADEKAAEDAIVVTGTKTPALTSSTLTVPGVSPLPKEITDLAAKEDVAAEEAAADEEDTAKDEIVATGERVADTGSATVGAGGGTGTNTNPDEIVVTGTKKTDADTGSSTLTVPGVAPLPKEITDLAEEDTVAKDDKNKLGVKELLALLGLLGSAGGGGGSGTGTGTGGKLQPIFSQKLPTPGKDGALMVGGLKGPTKGAAGTYSARPVTDWYRFGMGPAMDIPAGADLSRATSPYAGYGPGTLGEETFRAVSGIPAAPPAQPTGMAHGGSMGYARGSSRESFAVEGPGTGRSDDIPAVLSDGEYVIDAETVALLGDGSSKAGAKKLDQMRVNIRKHKGRNLAKGKFSVNAKAPERYLSGGRA